MTDTVLRCPECGQMWDPTELLFAHESDGPGGRTYCEEDHPRAEQLFLEHADPSPCCGFALELEDADPPYPSHGIDECAHFRCEM